MNTSHTRKIYAEKVLKRILPQLEVLVPIELRGAVLVEEHADGGHSAAFNALPTLRECLATQELGSEQHQIMSDLIKAVETVDQSKFYVVCFLAEDWMYSKLQPRTTKVCRKGFGGVA